MLFLQALANLLDFYNLKNYEYEYEDIWFLSNFCECISKCLKIFKIFIFIRGFCKFVIFQELLYKDQNRNLSFWFLLLIFFLKNIETHIITQILGLIILASILHG